MKNTLFAIAAIIGFLAISACHKSERSNGTITAKINGQPFKCDHCTIGSFISSVTGVRGLSIVGWAGGNTPSAPDLSFSIASYVTGSTGTYTVNNTFDSTFSVYASLDSTNFSGMLLPSGTINITSSSATSISGTFSFTAFSGTTITDGVFSAVGH